MTKTLIIGLLILTNSVFGQIPGKRFDGPIVIFDTLTVKKGDVIFLGKGSDPDSGNFIYITTPKKYMTDFTGNKSYNEFKNTPQGISNNYNGWDFSIKHFSKVSSTKNGDKILGVIALGPQFDENGTFNLGTYRQAVDFEAAIRAGEIIKINDIDFTKSSRTIETKIPHFTFTKNGVQPIDVVFNGIRKDVLYTKTLNWYNAYFKNKDENVITTFKNEEVIIAGQKKGVLISRTMGIDLFADIEYRFLIEFSDNEIRLNFGLGGEDAKITEEVSQEDYFDEHGEIKKMYKDLKISIEQMMNEISFLLADYLMN
jgi:hypothetical protein